MIPYRSVRLRTAEEQNHASIPDHLEIFVKAPAGPDGAGHRTIAKRMKVDLNDLKPPAVPAMSDEHLKKVVSEAKGKRMPVASVTDASAGNLIACVRRLRK